MMYYRLARVSDEELPTSLNVGGQSYQITGGGLLLAPAASKVGWPRVGTAIIILSYEAFREGASSTLTLARAAYTIDRDSRLLLEQSHGTPRGEGRVDGNEAVLRLGAVEHVIPEMTLLLVGAPDDPIPSHWINALDAGGWAVGLCVPGLAPWAEQLIRRVVVSGAHAWELITRPRRRQVSARQVRTAWRMAV